MGKGVGERTARPGESEPRFLWGGGCPGETFRGPEPSWPGEELRGDEAASGRVLGVRAPPGWVGSWVGRGC